MSKKCVRRAVVGIVQEGVQALALVNTVVHVAACTTPKKVSVIAKKGQDNESD